ncbi:MAG: GNAT family N-acetyltransferase [Vicinamibacterales bacterium]
MGAPHVFDTHASHGSLPHDPAARRPWTDGLPTLAGTLVDLRPLRRTDAPALAAVLTGADVTRFLSEPPSSAAAFERFIERFDAEARAGAALVMAVVPRGLDIPVGVVQVRRLDPAFQTAEWGFVVGSAFWGTGLFPEAASLLLDFVFDTVGVHRLEARCAVRNGRGNGVLAKLGAVQEGVLRQSTRLRGEVHDQALWALLAGEWRARRQRAAELRVH